MANETEPNLIEKPDSVEKPNTRATLFNTVGPVLLALGVGFMFLWVASMVVEHGKILATHLGELKSHEARLAVIESGGNRGLASHLTEDAAHEVATGSRLDKLEQALLLLQQTPGELKAIGSRLDGLHDGQVRLEKMLEIFGRKP